LSKLPELPKGGEGIAPIAELGLVDLVAALLGCRWNYTMSAMFEPIEHVLLEVLT
jgi:uncharacterized membrane protein